MSECFLRCSSCIIVASYPGPTPIPRPHPHEKLLVIQLSHIPACNMQISHYCPLSTLFLGCTVIDSVTKVHRAIENDISDWKMLGEELGINPTELDRIGRDQHGEQSRLRETIRVWQDRVPEDEFCWEKLIDALKSMKMIRLAKSISNQHHIKWKGQ